MISWKILFICLSERESQAGRVAGRGRSRLSAEQGAWLGTRCQDPGIMAWTEGRRLMAWATQVSLLFKFFLWLYLIFSYSEIFMPNKIDMYIWFIQTKKLKIAIYWYEK